MPSKINILKHLAVSALLIATFSGCVKKRSDVVMPGENLEYLVQIDKDGTTRFTTLADNPDVMVKPTKYTLTTGEKLEDTEYSKSKDVVLEGEVTNVRFLDIVDFETNDPLLTGRSQVAKMLGIPRTKDTPGKTYPIVYELSPNWLTICKVVPGNEIGHYEKAYSRKQGTNWIVPIGGYAIQGFWNIQYSVNEDNRSTNVKTKIPVDPQDYKKANYFSINRQAFQPFERVKKVDVLPVEMFTGEWYFSDSVAEARFDYGSPSGEIASQDSQLNPVSRVFFRLQEDSLWVYNSNIDEKLLENGNKLDYNVVFKVPVKMHEYRRKLDGSHSLGMSEEEVTESTPVTRNYLEIDTKAADSFKGILGEAENALRRFVNEFNNLKEVKDLRITKDFMSFSVEDGETGTIKRYAFRRTVPKTDYVGKRYHTSDFLHFGFFNMSRAQKMDYRTARKDDLDKRTFLARFNPNRNIVYHFSKITPKDKWVRDIGRETINLWAQAMKKAGMKNTIVLNEDFDVDVGDIRYNIINLPGTDGGSAGGFGPTLIDSVDGEIVAAVANVYLASFVDGSYYRIRSYLSRKAGLLYDFKDKSVSTKPGDQLINLQNMARGMYGVEVDKDNNRSIVPVQLGHAGTPEVAYTPAEQAVLTALQIPYDGASYDSVFRNVLKARDFYETSFLNFDAPDSAFGDNRFIDKLIESKCPEVVSYISTVKDREATTEEENQVIGNCANLMAQGFMLRALVHEIGHNFGLRHNFIGSADKANFVKPSAYQFGYIFNLADVVNGDTSSVMDYDPYENFGVVPSGYDIAAIRWAYTNKVELASDAQPGQGQLVEIDPQVEIDKNPSLAGKAVRDYKFCTDHNYILGTNPLCRQSDLGTDPYEVAAREVEEAYQSLRMIYRYDRFYYATAEVVLGSAIRELKGHYDQWRITMQNYTGPEKAYMQGFDRESHAALIKRMLSDPDPKVAKQNEQMLKMRNLITNFFLDIAFMNNKYCVTKNTEGVTIAVEFEKIRRQLFASGERGIVDSCSVAPVTAYLKKRDLTLVKEIGHALESYQYSMNPDNVDVADFDGTRAMRAIAFDALTRRFSASITNLINLDYYVPNMTDEPDIRELVTSVLSARLLDGVKLRDDKFEIAAASEARVLNDSDKARYIIKDAAKDGAYMVNFSAENNLLMQMTNGFINGLFVPGDSQESQDRFDPLFIGVTSNPRLVDGQYIPGGIIFAANRFFYVRNGSGLGAALLNKYSEISQKQVVLNIPMANLEEAYNWVQTNMGGALIKAPQKYTANDVFKIASLAQAVMQADGVQQDPALSYVLQELFSPDFKVVSSVFELLAKKGINIPEMSAKLQDEKTTEEEKKQIQEKIEKTLSMIDPAPYYAEIAVKDAKGVGPSTAGLKIRYDAVVKEFKAEKTVFARDVTELEAQKTMMLNLIMALGQ